MAYNFPDSPTPGQVFQKWTWNGSAWVLTTPVNSAASITFAPAGDIVATDVQAAIVEVDAEMHAADTTLQTNINAKFPSAGGTITGKTVIANADFTVYRSPGTTGVIFLNSAENRYLFWDGTNYQLGGIGVINPAAYLTNGRIAYAGDATTSVGAVIADLIAHAVFSGVRYTGANAGGTQVYWPDMFRCRAVQGLTTAWFTFPMA